MRQIYTSPRQDNIDRVVALLTEQGAILDNVMFGVRSYDKKGNRSLLVTPTPER